MKAETRKAIDALLRELRKPYLDLKGRELEAQWDFDRLRKGPKLDPEAVGKAAGKLMEARVRVLKLFAEYLVKRDAILGKSRKVLKKAKPPHTLIPSHDTRGGAGWSAFTACVYSDDASSYWVQTCYDGTSFHIAYADGSSQTIENTLDNSLPEGSPGLETIPGS